MGGGLQVQLQGMRINYNGECLYLFDLSSKEAFLPQTRDPETGKRSPSRPILPREWVESFGMTVDEHAGSTRIDLNDGYITTGVADEEIPEEKPANSIQEVYE